MAEQNFINHRQNVPGYLSVLAILLLTFIGAGVNLHKSVGDHERLYNAALILVTVGCLIMTALYARTFALKAQDRAIRAEENLRHFVLTGKLHDSRLTVAQIAGVRFASDAEYVALAKRAADENMPAVEIKKAVKNWRPDTHRV